MADQFDKLFESLITVEGGYVNDPTDSGGATMYGITETEARANGYEGKMQDMPMYFAKTIYRAKYWTGPRFDEVGYIVQIVANELFDTGVNCGVKVAASILQRCLNALNKGGTLYPDMKVDGEVGSDTLLALKRYVATRDGMVLLKLMNCLQGVYYIQLVERRVKDEKFIYGWIKNRI